MIGEMNFQPLIPEIFVATMACLVLLFDVYLKDRFGQLSYILTQGTLVVAFILTLQQLPMDTQVVLSGTFVGDLFSNVIKLFIYIIVFAMLIYSRQYLKDRQIFKGEYFVLALLGVNGMMIMASAAHFLTLYLGLELLSLSMYTMVAFQRDSRVATEAAMKYFILGAMASGMLLYGMSLIYGLTGTLSIDAVRLAVGGLQITQLPLVFGLVFIVVALAFKLGLVPFHMWIPDVYHGAPTSTTLYIGTAPKLAGLALVLRLLVGGLEQLHDSWGDMLIILAILSIAGGNIIAIAQTNLKRMLAYSTISHMGFMVLGILSGTENGYSAALFYAVVYAFMALGSFGMILLLSRQGFEADNIDDFKGLNRTHPWYAFLMLLLMFSMAGVPPTVGFYAKLSVIQALIDVNLIWLAVVAVLLAVIGAFYYLRIIKLMYFDDSDKDREISAPMDLRVIISANALAVLVIMPWVNDLFELCRLSIQNLAFIS